jgi:hypothetical protein
LPWQTSRNAGAPATAATAVSLPGWERADLPGVRFTDCQLPVAGQRICLPPGRYDWVYLALGGVGRRQAGPVDATIWLHYRGGVDPEFLRSLPLAAQLRSGTALARAGVPRRGDDLRALVLPELPGLRLLAVGLAAAGSIMPTRRGPA